MGGCLCHCIRNPRPFPAGAELVYICGWHSVEIRSTGHCCSCVSCCVRSQSHLLTGTAFPSIPVLWDRGALTSLRMDQREQAAALSPQNTDVWGGGCSLALSISHVASFLRGPGLLDEVRWQLCVSPAVSAPQLMGTRQACRSLPPDNRRQTAWLCRQGDCQAPGFKPIFGGERDWGKGKRGAGWCEYGEGGEDDIGE